MSRGLTAGALAEIGASRLRPVVFYEGVFSTGTLRLWSGIGPVSWNGQTWTGAGKLLGLAPIQEASEVGAVGFAVSLTGDATDIISLNLSAARQGYAGRVWLAFLDATGAIIADPFKSFEGRFDVPEIVDAGEQATIEARYESRLIDLDRARVRRYTAEDQKLDYPDDLGFDFVTTLQDAKLPWGVGIGGAVQDPIGITAGQAAGLGVLTGQFFPGFSLDRITGDLDFDLGF